MPGSFSRDAGFEAEGLKPFIAELRKSPERLDKEIRRRFRLIAADVRAGARNLASMQHPVPKFPRTRATQKQHWSDLLTSIQSGADSDTPWVAVGSDKVPWALGFEFGGGLPAGRGRRGGRAQFPPWRGNDSDAGYFLWPTVRDRQDDVVEQMLNAIEETLAGAYPD